MEPNLRVLIVDDEPLARHRLRRLLSGEARVEVAGECASAAEAEAALGEGSVDLLLLDVQMPGDDGFALLEKLPRERRPQVVFVTAHDEYAIRAFRVHALDFLLKPVDPVELHEAVVRAQERSSSEARTEERQEAADELDRRLRSLLAEWASPAKTLDRLLVRDGGRIDFVPIAEVHWFEAAGNYVRLHLGDRRLLHRQTLTSLEEQLDGRRFLRIHRSVIVNLDRVRELHRLAGGDFAVVLDSGERLTLSRTYRDRFEAAVGIAPGDQD